MIFYLRTGHGMWTNHDMMTGINGVNEKKRLSYSLSVMTGFRGRRGGGGAHASLVYCSLQSR